MRTLQKVGLLVCCFIEFSWSQNHYKIIEATSDLPQDMNYHTELFLELDDKSHVLGLIKKDTALGNKGDVDISHYSLEQMLKGVAILTKENREVIKLKIEDFEGLDGGFLQITYLRNAITMSYRTKVFDIIYEDGKWGLFDQVGEKTSALFLRTNWYFLLGCVGIESIEVAPCSFEKHSKPC